MLIYKLWCVFWQCVEYKHSINKTPLAPYLGATMHQPSAPVPRLAWAQHIFMASVPGADQMINEEDWLVESGIFSFR